MVKRSAITRPRVCPHCALLYEDGSDVCRDDGATLIPPKDQRTGIRVGNYRLMGVIGDGGMGTVYRGEHVLIGKAVAIKVLHPRFRRESEVVDRFLIEARAASMINHPNIIDITDFGYLPDECSFFVMEYLRGPSVAVVIDALDHLPVYRAVNIMTQACHALHACHSKGIAHRDLKPGNIVLVPQAGSNDLVHLDRAHGPLVKREVATDLVKLLDFGIAQIAELTADLDADYAAKGLAFGSPAYMSPEQAMGQLSNHRTDIYSIGVMFFEMLTGSIPYESDNPVDILRQHLQAPIPSVRDRRPDLGLPPEADRVIERAMAKEPEARHPTALDLLEDLERCFGNVIYGRDIGRYLEVRATREMQPVRTTAPVPETEEGLRRELSALFQGAYEEAAREREAWIEGSRHAELGDLFAADSPQLDGRSHAELGELFAVEDAEPQAITTPPEFHEPRGRPPADSIENELRGLFDSPDDD